MMRFYLLVIIPLFFSCKKPAEAESTADPVVPVTLTSIDTMALQNYVDLNATATYLVKNPVKANATGYLENVNVASNDFVKKGQVLFSLKTREAKVLGNTINKIDPELHFGNAINVRATATGYIDSINVQKDDYVQDGDFLGLINDASSFAIVMSLPYELKKYVSPGKSFDVYLPDGKSVKATMQKFMPTVDASSQTQRVILKVIGNAEIPENLIVKVRINKMSASKAISLPKAAVLSNETETEFWIMKMVNDDTAVKFPVKKGTETIDRTEILDPLLTKNDRILLTGNYGVGDTIKVKVVNPKS